MVDKKDNIPDQVKYSTEHCWRKRKLKRIMLCLAAVQLNYKQSVEIAEEELIKSIKLKHLLYTQKSNLTMDAPLTQL